ncbi:hypothetical protein MTO96_012894 [Rhipicephalus appendiculatus]
MRKDVSFSNTHHTAFWRGKEGETMLSSGHIRSCTDPVRCRLGLAVEHRRLPRIAVPRTTRADSGDTGFQAQAVVGEVGVLEAFPLLRGCLLNPPKARTFGPVGGKKRQYWPAPRFAPISPVTVASGRRCPCRP